MYMCASVQCWQASKVMQSPLPGCASLTRPVWPPQLMHPHTDTHAHNNTHTLDRLMQVVLSCSVAPAALVKSTEWCIGPQFFATFSQMKLTNDIIHRFNCRHFSRDRCRRHYHHPHPIAVDGASYLFCFRAEYFHRNWIQMEDQTAGGCSPSA